MLGPETSVISPCLAANLRIGIYTAQCVLSKVYFSAQPNKLRPILNFEFGIPLNINLSQLVQVCGKYIFFTFLWFWNSRSVISLKYVPVSSPASLNMPLYPPFFWLYRTGWKNLAASRREQKWQWKFSSSAYLQFSRQMRRFCASEICKINSVKYAIYTM